MINDITFKTASQIVSGIKNKEFSVLEVMKTHLSRIANTNDRVNAIVSLDEEKALNNARIADDILAKGNQEIGLLFGLPIAIKDTHHAKGFKTTMGSEIFVNQIAKTDHLIVKRMKNDGAIVIGKTNVPEFAAGSHTFNNVFGTTKNPYDLTKTAGGSSGGAAAALASGMIPLADGSDMGGSCRNPAAYNNVVGLRPSPGRIPIHPKRSLYSPLAVQGPLARNVSDIALILSIVTGFNKKSPLSSELSPNTFADKLDCETKGLRIGYSCDLNGIFPVAKSVRKEFVKQLEVFVSLGCELEEASPDFTNATEIFQTLRALEYVISYKDLYINHKEKIKSTVVWNIEQGLKLTGIDIAQAKNYQADLFESVQQFFEQYDFLILPVSQVQPFDANLEYPTEINKVKMTNYIEWMESCSHITVTGCPAISVPAGFCEDGLPFGLQIVAPFNDDFRLLQIAYAFEQATKYSRKRPAL